jgi:hypothetical protein
MKRLPRLRVTARKEAGSVLHPNSEKHESRIQHYLDLANVALSMKKKLSLSSRPRKSA